MVDFVRMFQHRKEDYMKLTFIGADHEVTGSCHYLECGDTKLVVDYGMEQGINRYENAEIDDEYDFWLLEQILRKFE